MNCKNCGFYNRESNQFCVSCGKPLLEETIQEDEKQSSNEVETLTFNEKPILSSEPKKQEQLDIFSSSMDDIEEVEQVETLNLDSADSIEQNEKKVVNDMLSTVEEIKEEAKEEIETLDLDAEGNDLISSLDEKNLETLDLEHPEKKEELIIPEITTSEGLNKAENANLSQANEELKAIAPLEEEEKLIRVEKPESVSSLILPFKFLIKPVSTVKEKVSKFSLNDAIATTLLSVAIIAILLFIPVIVSNGFNFQNVDLKTSVFQNVAYIFISIIGISVIYYVASLVTKEKTRVGEILGLTALTAIPFVITTFVLAPILNDLALISGIATLFIGVFYSLLIFIFGINEITLFKTGEGKLYYNLVCLGLIIIGVLAFYQDSISMIVWELSAFS